MKSSLLENRVENSKRLFERSQALVPGGVHSPVRAFRGVGGTPRFIRSAQGSELEDVDGNRYLDFCQSWGPLIFGHRDSEVLEGVEAALRRGWSFGTAEPYSLELAELICQNLPWIEKIRFVNSGTEAVMGALRVARAATGRNKILKFEGCYHGHADSMLVKAGSGLAEMASPDSAGVTSSVASETVVVPLDDLDAVVAAFQRYPEEIAAVIIEPVPANNGLLLQKENFLKRLVAIARDFGSLVIFDEVITGFRVSFGGMAELSGIRPDLVTYGKIIGGGFPVGAYGGRADLMDWVAPVGPVYQAGTLSANPVAMAAGLIQLKKLKRENPYPQLEKQARLVSERLVAVLAGQSELEDQFRFTVQQFGSLFWIVFGGGKDVIRAPSQIPSEHKAIHSKLFHSLLNQGVYLAPSAFEVSFLSTAHTEAQLENFIQKFQKCFLELLQSEKSSNAQGGIDRVYQ